LLERRIDEANAQAGGAHELGGGGILRRFGCQQSNAAGCRDLTAPVEHRLALGKTEADRGGGVLPTHLIGVEEGAFKFRPEPVRTAADRRRADEAGVGSPRCEQALDVVAGHQDIAVRHDDPIIGRRPPTLADIVELRVCADGVVADQQPRGNMRMVRDESANESERGIARRGGAKDDLVAGIVEVEG
jgi:hypothetical protein